MISGYPEVKKLFPGRLCRIGGGHEGVFLMRQKIVVVIGFTIGIATGDFAIPPLFAGLVGAATPEAIPAAWLGVMQVAVLGSGFGMAALGSKIVRSQAGALELGEATD